MLRAGFLKTWGLLALAVTVLSACFFVPPASAEPRVVAPQTAETVSIASELDVLVDPTGAATLTDVMGTLSSGFKPAGTDRPVFGVSSGAAWTRVTVDLSRDPERGQRRAQFSAMHPDTVSFFIVDEAGNVLRTYTGGLDVPGSNTYRKFSVAVGDLGVERFTLYARMTTHYISTLGQFLITAQEETQAEMAVERILGPLFGAILLAAFFCLLLWAYLREPVYGYGFAVVLSLLVTSLAHVNFDRMFWPVWLQDGDTTRLIYLGGSALVHSLGIVFTSYFLGTYERRPRLHTIACVAAIGIFVGMTGTVLALPYQFSIALLASMGTATALIVSMVIEALRTRRRAVIMYLVVAVPFLVCLALTNIASYHVITEHPISISLSVFGLTVLVVGITVGLADGFRERLETKVRERTAELSIANAALRDAHEAKNRMLGVVAHDLRNPLSGIRAAAQLLIDVPLEQSKRETLLRTIRDGADVTLSMTEDLLDVAAIREGKVELTPDSFDLSRLVEGRAELFRMSAQSKDIELRLDLARIPPVWADAKRTAQVLDNLVSNAIKYSPHEARVTIEVRAIDGRARLAVIDQGQGIPADELEDIFEPFERASPQPTGGERGVGLGLAIVKKLVEAQNGEIRVESALGRGSRFEMLLPFATAVVRNARPSEPPFAPGAITPA